MTFYLVITGPKVACRIAAPPQGSMRLGSNPTSDICVDIPGIAPLHVELFFHPTLTVRAYSSDVSVTDSQVGREVAVATGSSKELFSEDHLRVGGLEIRWFLEPPAAEPIHALDWSEVETHSDLIPAGDPVAIARFKGGDEVLARLQRKLGVSDLLARTDTNEYAVLLANRSLPEANGLMQEIRPEAFGLALWQSESPRAALKAATPRRQSQERSMRTQMSRDPAMLETLRMLDQAARSQEPALFVGETGTGKDYLINELHGRSRSPEHPLIRLSSIDIGDRGIPESILASAAGGTLVIDEVAALSTTAQLSLARDLERGYLSGIRLVATSSEPLEQAVKHERVNKGLYFRLARFLIQIPPLRQRPLDIVDLANAFLAAHQTPALLPPLEAIFQAYRWPGNVRELESIVARAVLSSGQNDIQLEHLPGELRNVANSSPESQYPPSPSSAGEPLSLREEIAALERRRIIEALDAYPTQTEAAKALGIPLRTFVNRMDTLGIPRARKKP